jgi:hypothetical protein
VSLASALGVETFRGQFYVLYTCEWSVYSMDHSEAQHDMGNQVVDSGQLNEGGIRA